MKATKMLTFELAAQHDEIDIHCNEQGLKDLIDYLERLLKSEQLSAHDHLMTPAWGGDELTGEKQGANSMLINKVNVRYWRSQ